MLQTLIRSLARAPEPAPVPDRGPRLFTIGYQDHTQGSLLASLARLHVTILCDVRRTAVSRKSGFARQTLANACAQAGIRYEHLWQLGIASERRRGVTNRREREQLLEDYRLRILPNQQASLEQVRGWLVNGDRVALMCFERHREDCHRSCVAAALDSALGANCRPIHL
jgi:uncharacterized protein (DUF488 family)